MSEDLSRGVPRVGVNELTGNYSMSVEGLTIGKMRLR